MSIEACGIIKENEIISNGGKSLDAKIYDTLARLGIKQTCKGYIYIHEAIKSAIEDPESALLVTKIMYPKLGKKFNKKPWAIERVIRYAVNELPITRFRYIVFSGNMGHYTNKEFILQVSRYLQFH